MWDITVATIGKFVEASSLRLPRYNRVQPDQVSYGGKIPEKSTVLP